jgi:hypothetical protein
MRYVAPLCLLIVCQCVVAGYGVKEIRYGSMVRCIWQLTIDGVALNRKVVNHIAAGAQSMDS